MKGAIIMTLKKQSIGDFRKLDVYCKAILLNKKLYGIIEKFPSYEKTNLSDQLRRASVSVCGNLAEGVGNFYYGKQFDRLNSAIGSLCECQCYLDIATMLGYISQDEYRAVDGDAKEVLKMLIRLAKHIESAMSGEAS